MITIWLLVLSFIVWLVFFRKQQQMINSRSPPKLNLETSENPEAGEKLNFPPGSEGTCLFRSATGKFDFSVPSEYTCPPPSSFRYIYPRQIEHDQQQQHRMEELPDQIEDPSSSPEYASQLTYGQLKMPEDRSVFFPQGDNPGSQIDTFVNDGYYPNNPPLDQTLRNPNLQVRSEPPNLASLPSQWNQSTIVPDMYRRPFEFRKVTY